jgi:hypothetical protein
MVEISIDRIAANIADDFVKAAVLAGLDIPRAEVTVECTSVPHRPPSSLPAGKLAVYVFMLGPRCLKVGKTGPNSAARFCSQHYGIKAPSTLAKSLLRLQSSIGISGVEQSNVKAWICEHTRRVNFLIPSKYGVFSLSFLEAFIQCRLQPEFEGFANQRSRPET